MDKWEVDFRLKNDGPYWELDARACRGLNPKQMRSAAQYLQREATRLEKTLAERKAQDG